MSEKKKKLSDRIIIKLWGRKKKKIIADDNKVKVETIPMTFGPTLEEYVLEFERETGKHAYWGGKLTKQFLAWKEKHVLS